MAAAANPGRDPAAASHRGLRTAALSPVAAVPATLAVLLAVLLGGCTGENPAGTGSTSAGMSTPAATSSPTRADATATTPKQIARSWFGAYHARRWNEPAHSWIRHTSPYVTGALARRYRDGPQHDTADQRTFTAHRCAAHAVGISVVQPGEAPQTRTNKNLQLTGTLRTRCETGDDPADQLLEATVRVHRTHAGWRVAEQLN